MKRHPSLAGLSREHHTALVLAKGALRVDLNDGEQVARYTVRLAAAIASELEPHFRQEEVSLLPLLEQQQESALVARTLDEHQALRHLVVDIKAGDRSAIPLFGRSLEAHVRFEERELFVRAEAVLSPALLQFLQAEH